MVTGLSTTWCQVCDMDRSIAFYRDVLGLTPLMQSPFWSEFQLGPAKIALHHRIGDGSGPCGEDGKGWYLGLVCDDVAALKEAVVQAGGTEHGYHQTPGGVVLTIADLDGNPMQALQPGSKIEDLG